MESRLWTPLGIDSVESVGNGESKNTPEDLPIVGGMEDESLGAGVAGAGDDIVGH